MTVTGNWQICKLCVVSLKIQFFAVSFVSICLHTLPKNRNTRVPFQPRTSRRSVRTAGALYHHLMLVLPVRSSMCACTSIGTSIGTSCSTSVGARKLSCRKKCVRSPENALGSRRYPAQRHRFLSKYQSLVLEAKLTLSSLLSA